MSNKKIEKAKKKLKKMEEKYQLLQERYKVMDDYLQELIDTDKYKQVEMNYLCGFIEYKKLDDEYAYFKKHAHEEADPELPFPVLVL